jgi:hypothetical protein
MQTAIKPIVGCLLAIVFWAVGGCTVTRPGNFANYPQQVQVGAAPVRTYVQQPGYYAVHYAAMPESLPERIASDAVAVMDEEAIAVFSGTPTERNASTNGTVTPVYALESGGSIAIPTGQIFIRFAETIPAASRQDAIAAAGYEIVEIPEYAPYTVWVRSSSGDIAASLEGVSCLRAMAGVENVEPQMLMQRRLK